MIDELKKGDIVTVISDNCRLPKGTKCVITIVLNTNVHNKPYYIRNVDSQYSCWASLQDLQALQ